MTLIALSRGLNMVGRLTGCRGAVMAARTGAGNIFMIKGYRTPGRLGGMTSITLGGGLNMVSRLAGGSNPVMTARTGPCDTAVIKFHHTPIVG